MPSTEVAIGLVAAIVIVIAAIVFFRARSRPAAPTAKDRAWDLHARNRSSSIPAEAPAPPPSKRAAPPSSKRAAPPSSKRKGETTSPADAKPAKPAAPAKAKAPAKPPAPPPKPAKPALPSLQDDLDEDDDLTIVTLGPLKPGAARAEASATATKGKPPPAARPVPKLVVLPSDDLEPDSVIPERDSAVPIVYDEEAAIDEPTHVDSLILVSAAGQTDRGQRRRKNEDSYAILDNHGIFIVADGMGGHSGGEIASKIAVDTIADAFRSNKFPGEHYPGVPRRGSELALAIQAANQAIFERARAEHHLSGMGTTVVSARFSPNKQRAYIGHVGDSRCYRLRNGELRQITTDHTMGAAGLTGPLADRLERAVGVGPSVKVDVILARPLPEDLYLLCSDGLSKMVPAPQILEILLSEKNLDKVATKLVERANASGGKDNITVILVKVTSPAELARSLLP